MNGDRVVYGFVSPTVGMHGFTDEERERIREELVETGRELLLTFGPRKTNVADVTAPVGIAKSTFYVFFDSKAELFLEIVERETESLRAEIADEIAEVEDPREGLERLFRAYRRFAEENPLIQQLLRQEDHRELFRSVPPERLERVQQEALGDMVPVIEAFQDRCDGLLAELDPVTVLMLMGTIGQTVLHRDEYEQYGEGYYERMQEAHVTALARGLTADGS